MWRMNTRQESVTSESSDADINALRASYWAIMAASAHSVFSNSLPGLNASRPTAVKRLNGDTHCQWLPQQAEENRRQSRQPLQKPIIRKSGESSGLNPQQENAIQSPARSSLSAAGHTLPAPAIGNTGRKVAEEKINRFFFKASQSSPSKQQTPALEFETPHGSIDQPHCLQKVPQPGVSNTMLEAGLKAGLESSQISDNLSDIFNQEFAHEGLFSDQGNWVTKAMSQPKLVAGVIGLCLLAASVYAGLGYWWISATGFSHAAEPDRAITSHQPTRPQTHSNSYFLKNIEALQKESHLIRPKPSAQSQERLIAQATPMKTFTIKELKSSSTEPTGRPDPFSPLIQEGENGLNALNDPKQKKDILADVQYTGFIGDVNNKNLVAVIRMTDPGTGESKTLIKKTGDSFYVEGERIYLKGISKSGLTLRAEGVNRKLEINPYQELVSVNKNEDPSSMASPDTAASANSPRSTGNNSQTSPRLQEPE